MRTYQKDYVKIISDTGCYSFLGRLGGEQRLSLLKNGCLYVGIIQHEFIHALGYAHMHSHADRDAYISINYSNVPGGEGNGNFRKVDPKFFSNFNTPYDYLSVMHYGTYAFAINNSIKVITTKDSKFQNLIGQRNGPSLDDFRRLNRMYECKGVVLI
jgi:choriolysin H